MSEQAFTKKTTTAGAVIGMAVVGLILMVAGWQVYELKLLKGIEEPLVNMGIPVSFGKTISVIGAFLLLFKVFDFFFLSSLHEAINRRTGELESTFTEVENLRAEMATLKSDYERRLAETEASAREQIQAQIREAQDLKKSLMADAQRQAEDYKNQAIAEIEAEKRKVLTDLRVEVTKLSLQATEKILGENIDNDRNRKLIDEFLTTVEVRN